MQSLCKTQRSAQSASDIASAIFSTMKSLPVRIPETSSSKLSASPLGQTPTVVVVAEAKVVILLNVVLESVAEIEVMVTVAEVPVAVVVVSVSVSVAVVEETVVVVAVTVEVVLDLVDVSLLVVVEASVTVELVIARSGSEQTVS